MKNPIAFLIVKQWDFLQKYILLPIWVVLKSQKTDIIVVCKSETSVKNREGTECEKGRYRYAELSLKSVNPRRWIAAAQ